MFHTCGEFVYIIYSTQQIVFTYIRIIKYKPIKKLQIYINTINIRVIINIEIHNKITHKSLILPYHLSYLIANYPKN